MSDRPVNETGERILKYSALAIVAVVFMALAVLIPAYLESERKRTEELRRAQAEQAEILK